MVNKVYAFKFENMSIFSAFPLPSIETGTKFHVFQFDMASKRTLLPIVFIAHFDVTHENVLLRKILENSMLSSFTCS